MRLPEGADWYPVSGSYKVKVFDSAFFARGSGFVQVYLSGYVGCHRERGLNPGPLRVNPALMMRIASQPLWCLRGAPRRIRLQLGRTT